MGIDYTPEKTIKKNINAYLNFIKGMKHNFKNPGLKACIKNIDNHAKRILLNNNIPIEIRAAKLKLRIQKYIDSINATHNNKDRNKEQKRRNLNMLIRKLEPLIKLSKQEGRNIANRDGLTSNHYAQHSIPNKSCRYYPSFIPGEEDPNTCLCGMDMTFCSKNCGYATNNALATKAYKADTIIYGGLEGVIAWNKGGKGIKVKTPTFEHINKRNEDDYRQHRYDEIERYSYKGHVGL